MQEISHEPQTNTKTQHKTKPLLKTTKQLGFSRINDIYNNNEILIAFNFDSKKLSIIKDIWNKAKYKPIIEDKEFSENKGLNPNFFVLLSISINMIEIFDIKIF